MALDLTLLSKNDSGYSYKSQQFYSYLDTSDNLATISASGYFNNATDILRQYDLIFVVSSDPDLNIYYVSSATGAATVTIASLIDTSIIPDGSITNAKVNATAGIVPSKFALTTGSIIVGAASVGAELDVSTDTQIVVGNGTTITSVAVSGDATLSNAGVLTLAVPKIRGSVRHTWAGGAATTDTVTLTGVAATDVIHVTVTANSGVGVVVSAERSGADSILVTTSANMADGDILSVTAVQVV